MPLVRSTPELTAGLLLYASYQGDFRAGWRWYEPRFRELLVRSWILVRLDSPLGQLAEQRMWSEVEKLVSELVSDDPTGAAWDTFAADQLENARDVFGDFTAWRPVDVEYGDDEATVTLARKDGEFVRLRFLPDPAAGWRYIGPGSEL